MMRGPATSLPNSIFNLQFPVATAVQEVVTLNDVKTSNIEMGKTFPKLNLQVKIALKVINEL